MRSFGYLLVVSVCGVVAANAGDLTGTVYGAKSGTRIRDAVVVAVQKSEFGSSGPHVARARTSQEGTFELPALPKGLYGLCVHNLNGYLDPCQWGQESQVLIDQNGKHVELVLQEGKRVSVSIKITNQVLDLMSKTDVPAVMPVIVADGRVCPLQLTKRDESYLEFAITVPLRKSVRLRFNGPLAQTLRTSDGTMIDVDDFKIDTSEAKEQGFSFAVLD